ncbi:MAG: excinuclease ABC subunit UvrC [Bacteroidales bacterium]|nr:excinuclease ABC subunit UvrC [Candidatus Minthousia equi]
MKQEILEKLKGIVHNLPESPGCYQYLNNAGTIIYVGKAKNLKRRVSSYFNKDQKSLKTKVLVSKIYDIKYVVVSTERDALLLENNLIKKYKPHYNVLLKDDKTYPSVCITKEHFPRVFKTRQIDKRGGNYYGPFTNVYALNTMLELFKKLYPIRTCNFTITPESIESSKHKVCLEYHIKNCLAPCVGKLSHEQYMQYIEEIREILKGNVGEISKKLKGEMLQLASELRFEEAQLVKMKYEALETFRNKSEVVSQVMHNIDVFSIEDDKESAFINYLHITNGCINQAFTFEYKRKMGESNEELLVLGIVEMRERYHSQSKEIIVPFPIDLPLDVTITIPQRGDKKTLLDLSLNNVRQYKFDKVKRMEKLNPEQKTVRLMTEIKEAMNLPKLPIRIECFDNSNISGTDAVAACVVFEKCKPNKQQYRKYNIKTVVGPDDYASMQEVVRRRYTRIINEAGTLPDLIITDGGKGQMEVVRKVVEDELHLHIPIAGLAKDNHHRTNELLYGFPPIVIGMKTDSPIFKLLTRIQDEVHRFAITFHRDKRSKTALHSELDEIKGIGEKTKSTLLKHFKSVARMKKATQDDIAKVIGEAKAKLLIEAFNK